MKDSIIEDLWWKYIATVCHLANGVMLLCLSHDIIIKIGAAVLIAGAIYVQVLILKIANTRIRLARMEGEKEAMQSRYKSQGIKTHST